MVEAIALCIDIGWSKQHFSIKLYKVERGAFMEGRVSEGGPKRGGRDAGGCERWEHLPVCIDM